jgi:hypothetical protein
MVDHQQEFDLWGDPEEGRRLREIGIDAAAYGSEDWVHLTEAVIGALCRRVAAFTTDRVWFYLEELPAAHTGEPRAMGAAMRRAAGRGWCEATAEHVLSKRPECHRRPIRVWRSRLYRGDGCRDDEG